eukprot:1814444-Pyramimonas_sp.AAC.2
MRLMYDCGTPCARIASQSDSCETVSNAFLKSNVATHSGSWNSRAFSCTIANVNKWSSVLKFRRNPACSGFCFESNIGSSRLYSNRENSLYMSGIIEIGR